MQHKKIPLADTKAFSPFFLDYLERKHHLESFFERFPVPENFKAQITAKENTFPASNRRVLVSTLTEQYARLDVPDAVRKNINALAEEKTFTVTTGHQLNIFTGPLYFIYKIITVINACKQLRQAHPEYHFVPVYWMASEDHDYDEIKYFRLYGEKYVWETNQKGAVGRFQTDGLDELAGRLPGDVSIFHEAYTKNKTLADAARHYVNALFGSEGLVVLDADNANLKRIFQPVIEADIFSQITVGLVNETNTRLSGLGYSTQVYCRDINFFYLDDGIRSRIEKQGETYRVLDTSLEYSEASLRKVIEGSPEKFSPNVILRPLYQEMILPNLAYVGGPSEIVYWLQLKSVFDHFRVPMPLLMPRNFAMVVEHTIRRKMDKTGVPLSLFFENKDVLFNHWIHTHAQHDLSVDGERAALEDIFARLRKRAEAIDQTLGPLTGAEGARAIKSLEKIQQKLVRAEKRLQADKLRQIEAVKDALFPNGGLQERTDNFLNFYQQDHQFISKLIDRLDPFDYRFNILTYDGA